MSVPFILASASPRRAMLLREAGYRFEVEPAEIDESPHVGESAEGLVHRLANEKAAEVARRFPNRIVLAADTMVVCDGELLGKPRDFADAGRMIRTHAGRWHEVMTGVAVSGAGVRVIRSIVHIPSMTDEQIQHYLASGRWQGKAGGYGVQDDPTIVGRVEGCHTNVIGLPMSTTREMLMRVGVLPCS